MIFIKPENAITTPMYTFEIEGDCLVAGWSGQIDPDSREFNASIELLMETLADRNISGLLIYSTASLNGNLTMQTLNILEEKAPSVFLKKIAVLESMDFLWDNNLLQTLNYIKESAELNTEISSFPSKGLAMAWLAAG